MRNKSKSKVVDGHEIFHVELPDWEKNDEEYYSLSLDDIRVILDTDNKIIQNRWKRTKYQLEIRFAISKEPYTYVREGHEIGKCQVFVEWKGKYTTYRLRDTIVVKSPIDGETRNKEGYKTKGYWGGIDPFKVIVSTSTSDRKELRKFDYGQAHHNKDGLQFEFNKSNVNYNVTDFDDEYNYEGVLIFSKIKGYVSWDRPILLGNFDIRVISNHFFIKVDIHKEKFNNHDKLKYYTKDGVSLLNLKYKKKNSSYRFYIELFFPTTMNQVSEFLGFSEEIYLVSDSDPVPIEINRVDEDFELMLSYLKQEVYPLVEVDEEISEETEDSSCYVYLMKDTSNGYYKIGISKDPVYRERTLQSEKPTIELVKKKLFTSRKNSKEVEKLLHQKFLSHNVRGEWFSLDEKDVTLLIELLS